MSRAVVTVDAGACGFSTRIEARPRADGLVDLRIESECENVRSLGGELRELDPMTVLAGAVKDGPVLACAARHSMHHACPVPVGIIKAVEVAAGLAPPADATIKVEKEEE